LVNTNMRSESVRRIRYLKEGRERFRVKSLKGGGLRRSHEKGRKKVKRSMQTFLGRGGGKPTKRRKASRGGGGEGFNCREGRRKLSGKPRGGV